jgi:ABC-type phosphate transport system ATPase subunit
MIEGDIIIKYNIQQAARGSDCTRFFNIGEGRAACLFAEEMM